jgi:hypothetical protein
MKGERRKTKIKAERRGKRTKTGKDMKDKMKNEIRTKNTGEYK